MHDVIREKNKISHFVENLQLFCINIMHSTLICFHSPSSVCRRVCHFAFTYGSIKLHIRLQLMPCVRHGKNNSIQWSNMKSYTYMHFLFRFHHASHLSVKQMWNCDHFVVLCWLHRSICSYISLIVIGWFYVFSIYSNSSAHYSLIFFNIHSVFSQ